MDRIRKIINDVDAIIKRNMIEPPLDLSLINYLDNYSINTYLWSLSKSYMLIILRENKNNIDADDYCVLLTKIDEIYEILEKI